MTAQDIQLLVGAFCALLALVGTGAKWLIGTLEIKYTKLALGEANARDDLSRRLHEEIGVLRLELADMRAEKKLFQRRIYMLEAFIHRQPGIDIPKMEGWPP